MSSSPRYVVLGTAGHIDHGKTSLVRALTGIDTDTLEEEKRRGITINLGFAHFALPDGTQVGVVDVPGHQRFIRNMVAGAVGIDILLLVVAADDGVMPQTVEHLQIARLLGVHSGVIALSKADLVEPELLELARADIARLVQGTFLEDAQLIAVSSTTGAGLTELTAAIQQCAQQLQTRGAGEIFRMPIDRSFTVKGAGTVVTGTTASGTLSADSEVEILPQGRRLRVRGIQLHGREASEVGPGHRAAVNLTGIDRDEISRGDVLVSPGALLMTQMLDASAELLPGAFAPLRRGSEVELHIGTAELTAKVHPLEAPRLAPGSSGLVQLRLAEPVAAAAGDRFILRSSSGEMTIGGGEVLDAHPTKHRRRREAAAEQLIELELESGPLIRLVHEVEKQPWGLPLETAARLLASSVDALRALAAEGSGSGLMLLGSGRQEYLSTAANRKRLRASVVHRLESYHELHPLSLRGLSLNELFAGLSTQVAGLNVETVKAALEEGLSNETFDSIKGSFALPGRSLRLSAKDNQTLNLLRARITGSKPAQPDELLAEVPVDKKRLQMLVRLLVEEGELAAAPGPVFFSTAEIRRVRQILLAQLPAYPTGVTVSDFNKLAESSRKFGIPLLQYFENEGLLLRDGDLRRLNPAARA